MSVDFILKGTSQVIYINKYKRNEFLTLWFGWFGLDFFIFKKPF